MEKGKIKNGKDSIIMDRFAVFYVIAGRLREKGKRIHESGRSGVGKRGGNGIRAAREISRQKFPGKFDFCLKMVYAWKRTKFGNARRCGHEKKVSRTDFGVLCGGNPPVLMRRLSGRLYLYGAG